MLRYLVISAIIFSFTGKAHAQFKDVAYRQQPIRMEDSITPAKMSHRLSPGKVALMSTIIPGSGQIYNGQWYKAGALYVGMAFVVYFINFNEHYYSDFKLAYQMRTDNNPLTIDKYDTASHSGQPFISDPNSLADYREYYHHNRDLLYILSAVIFTANIIDAYVYAHLKEFDISDKLTLNFNLMKFSNIANGINYTPSISLRF